MKIIDMDTNVGEVGGEHEVRGATIENDSNIRI